MGIHKKTGMQKPKQPHAATRSTSNSLTRRKTSSRLKTGKHPLAPLAETYQHLHELILQQSHLAHWLKPVCALLNQDRHYYCSWIALYSESDQHFHQLETAGLGQAAKTLHRLFEKHEYPPCILLLKQKKSMVIKNPGLQCAPCPLALVKNDLDVYFVPISYQNSLYGVLTVSAPANLPTAQSELRFLQSTASLLAFTLHKIHLDHLCTQNESSLQSNQEKLHHLFKTMVEGVAIFDVLYGQPGYATDYILRDANPAYCRYLEVPLSQLQNQPSNFFLQQGIPPHLDTFLKVSESGNPVSFEAHYERLNKHFLLSAFSPKRGSFILILNDITEKQKLENALLENEARLRLALEAANQGFWEWQKKNNRIQFSPAFFTILSLAPETDFSLTLDALEKLIHPQDKDQAFTTILKHAQKKSENFEIEVRVQNQQRLWLWMLVRGKVIARDLENNPIRITGTYINMNDRKQNEEFLKFQKEFALETTTLLDLNAVLVKSIEKVLTLTGIDSGGIYIADESQGLKLIAHQGLSPEFVQTVTYFDKTSARVQIIKKGKPIYTHYASFSKDRNPVQENEHLKAFVAIPIMHQKEMLGCLNLASHSYDTLPQQFHEVLESYAALIGNIILRIQAQLELKQSEERYRSIFDQSPIGIIVFSAEGERLSINKACLDIFGVSDISQIEPINLFTIPALSHHDKAALLNGESIRDTFIFDFNQLAANGIVRSTKTGRSFLDAQLIPLGVTPETVPTGYLVQLHDITERKQHEAELLKRDTRMDMALWGSGTAFWDIMLQTGEMYFDPRWLEMLEYQPTDLVPNIGTWQKLIHPDDLPHVMENLNDHFAEKNPYFEAEYRMPSKTGQWRWFLDRGKVVERDRQGKSIRVSGTHLDITQRKQAEKALLTEQNKAQTFLAVASFAIVAIDREQKVLFINPKGCEILGYPEKDIIGKNWFDTFLPDEIQAQVKNVFVQLIQGTIPNLDYFENYILTRNGERRLIAWHNALLKDQEGITYATLSSGEDITDKNAALENLRESEARMKLTLQGANSGMLDFNISHDVVHLDTTYCQILELPSSEFIGSRTDFWKLIHPDDLPGNQALIQKHLDGKTPYFESDLRFLTPTGKIKWVHARNLVVSRSADGKPLRLVGIGMDITEHKQAEFALQQSNERFKILFENAADGVLVADPVTKTFLLANKAICKTLGYLQEELIGAPLSKIHPPENFQAVVESFELLASGKINIARAVPLTSKTGHLLFVDINATVLTLEGKTCLVGFFRDITEQKRAQQEVQEAKIRLESVIENTPEVAIQGFNRQGIICHWNKACESIYGFKKEEVIGRHFRDSLLPGELGDDFENILETIFQTRLAIEPKEWECATKDGRRRWVFSSTFPIFENNEVSEVFCMDVDITMRKETEIEILQAKEKAEETNIELELAIENANDLARQAAIADAAKSQFLANVSHEIRTPMNSIIGFAEMMLDSELSVEQRNSVETILHSTETLMTLMNDILDLSKVEAGQMELEKIPMHLETIILDVCELVRGKIGKKSIEILCDFGSCPTLVVGDPTRLRQVLLNLLGNAVKFTKVGEIVTTLTLLSENDKSLHIQCSIRDTGIGIPQNKIQKIFEPFTQADGSTSRIFGGTGLGLPISRKLVHLMGGELAVQTRLNEGSIFSFDLWLEKPKQNEMMDTSLESEFPLKGLQVIVIDDNPTALGILQSVVVQLGMTCTPLTSFEQGLHQLSTFGCDVVLLDLHLPDLDVAQLRSQANLRQAGKQVLVIALSSFPFREKQSEQLSYFDGVLAKPISKRSLTNLIRPLLYTEASDTASQKQFFQSKTKSGSVKILLAEDNKSNQEIMLKILERMGHQADIASDGHEVLLLADKNKYDLIFMDMQMPKMGGLEATYMLRQRGCQVPIIALTANAMIGDRERCLTAGMNDYICKPIKRDSILDILHRYAGINPASESPETLRILLVGKDDAYVKSVYDAFHQAFPMSSCRITSSGIEASVLMGSFFPDLFIIDLHVTELDTFALINFIKSENRYSHTRIIAFNGQALDKIHLQTLRHMGIAVLLPPKVYVQKFVSLARQLLTNAYSFRVSEPESDLSLVEAISHELGISTKDYYDILDIFLKNTPDKIRTLKTALDEENGSKAADIAHSIKSSALSLRLHTLADPASRLEKLAEGNKFPEMDTYFTTLQNAFEAIRLTMKPSNPSQPSDSASAPPTA